MEPEPDSLSDDEDGTDKETHLRRRVVDEKKVETIGQSPAASKLHKSTKDPLRWFGLLVPPSLRTAQKNFKEGAIYLEICLLYCSFYSCRNLMSIS